jgi:ATP-dependent RNA helicase DDX42
VWTGSSDPPAKRPKFGYQEALTEDGDGYFAADNEEHKLDGECERPEGEEDEVDPLDAYMIGLEAEASAAIPSAVSRFDAEDEHDEQLESFAKDLARQNTLVFKKGETLEALEYDSDEKPILKKRIIESLPPLDHHTIPYPSFNKIFYKDPSTLGLMTEEELRAARSALQISVQGNAAPRLISSFSGFHFPEKLLKTILAQGFERPTPIQMQAVPVAMVGRDLLGIAATGSGKTLSFVWPMLVHISEQPPLKSSEPGPIGIIVAPTRELADQIYEEARKFAKCFERRRGDRTEKAIRVAPLVGGIGKGDTRAMLRANSHELVVATPGRLIEMIKLKLISTYRTTMLVLDEADKMFDLGFEPQLKSIVGQIRPDRQTLLFSATFKPNIENLAREILFNPIRISVGTIGGANKDITQIVEILPDEFAKQNWLVSRIQEFVLDGSVLIFAGSKMAVDEMTSQLSFRFPSISVASLHGDKTSDERNSIMADYKAGKCSVLVATDLAARGLDVPSIKTVINFQNARDIDAHTHRIGRTGRAGDKLGIAYTLLTPFDTQFAGLLVKNLETANQEVSSELLFLARQHPKFRDHEDRKRSETRHRGLSPTQQGLRGAQRGALQPHNPSRSLSLLTTVATPPAPSTTLQSPKVTHSFPNSASTAEAARPQAKQSFTGDVYDPFSDL